MFAGLPDSHAVWRRRLRFRQVGGRSSGSDVTVRMLLSGGDGASIRPPG